MFTLNSEKRWTDSSKKTCTESVVYAGCSRLVADHENKYNLWTNTHPFFSPSWTPVSDSRALCVSLPGVYNIIINIPTYSIPCHGCSAAAGDLIVSLNSVYIKYSSMRVVPDLWLITRTNIICGLTTVKLLICQPRNKKRYCAPSLTPFV